MNKTFLIAGLLIYILNSANAQYNASSGIWDNKIPYEINPVKDAAINSPDTTSAACNGTNTFWSLLYGNSGIREYSITGNTIAYTGNSLSTFPGPTVAMCNNLNGGSISPTFYTNTGGIPKYWNGGTTFVNCGTFPITLDNGAGYGNYLYYYWLTNLPGYIMRYDGVTLDTVIITSKYSGCADVAVDASGNIYLITSPNTNTSDSLYVYSPTGQLIKQYSLVFNCYNAYGCFLLNGTLYIGVGPFNTINPNIIIPVTFAANSVSVGTTLTLPQFHVLNFDLGSCNPGLPLGINGMAAEYDIKLAPNPASNFLHISVPNAHTYSYRICSVDGHTIVPNSDITSTGSTVNISHLAKGMYVVEIISGNSGVRKKFVKM